MRGIEDLGERLRTLVAGNDRVGQFLWPLFRDFLIYSAEMVPEISDRIVEIDRAMRWGFAFELGPFELWDALGFEQTARRGCEAEGCVLPRATGAHVGAGASRSTSRRISDGQPGTRYFDIQRGAMQRSGSRGRACSR